MKQIIKEILNGIGYATMLIFIILGTWWVVWTWIVLSDPSTPPW